ncbi:unnamed protein product [Closterium sp. NIES-54]
MLPSRGLGLNALTGSIPSTIGNLKNLIFLSVRANLISQTIPESIGDLINLKDLRRRLVRIHTIYHQQHEQLGTSVSNNHSHISSSIGNMRMNFEWDLHSNHLMGSMPPSIGNLESLTHLDLFGNQLTGSIPSSLGNLLDLRYLSVRSNFISQSIPASIGNLINLRYM